MRRPVRIVFGVIVGLALAELLLRGMAPGHPVTGAAFDAGDGWVEYRVGTDVMLRARRVPERPRVVFMGASTVLGVPFAKRMSPPAWLQLIFDRWGVDAEVLSMAHEASNSSDVGRWIDFVVSLEPTLVVVLTGHNEYLHPRLWLDDHWWHRSELADRLVARLGLEPRDVPRTPTADRPFPHDRVAERYAANLEAMQAACAAADVELLVCVPPSNLAQCPPVMGRRAEDAWARAVEHVRRGEHGAAHADFLAARDLDAWPHRATSALGASVRSGAWTFVDVEQAFLQASVTRTPGSDLFVDSCHPTVAGQRLLALTVADAIRRAGWLSFPDPLPEPPSASDGVTAFGFTEDDRRKGRRDADRMLLHLVVASEQTGPLARFVRRRLEEPRWRRRDQVSLALLAAMEGDAARLRETVESLEPPQRASVQAYFDSNPRVADAFRRCGVELRDEVLVSGAR